jgi:hypothetical protein
MALGKTTADLKQQDGVVPAQPKQSVATYPTALAGATAASDSATQRGEPAAAMTRGTAARKTLVCLLHMQGELGVPGKLNLLRPESGEDRCVWADLSVGMCASLLHLAVPARQQCSTSTVSENLPVHPPSQMSASACSCCRVSTQDT